MAVIQAYHTPLTTTHKFENLHALQRKLDVSMLLPAVRPIVALFWLKTSQFNLSPEAQLGPINPGVLTSPQSQ